MSDSDWNRKADAIAAVTEQNLYSAIERSYQLRRVQRIADVLLLLSFMLLGVGMFTDNMPLMLYAGGSSMALLLVMSLLQRAVDRQEGVISRLSCTFALWKKPDEEE